MTGNEVFAAGGLSEILFRRLAVASGVVLVQCVEPAVHGRGGFTGGWEIYAQNVGEDRWMMLTTTRAKNGTFRPKRFVTVNGVLAFLQDLGFSVVALPLAVDGKIILRERGGVVKVRVVSDAAE